MTFEQMLQFNLEIEILIEAAGDPVSQKNSHTIAVSALAGHALKSANHRPAGTIETP
jgi:hypothetical protein